jgi:hypothetical protein
MIFGPFEILLCLAPLFILIFAIGVGLAAQNVIADREERERGLIECVYCRKMLNPEAYICRFCLNELRDPFGAENPIPASRSEDIDDN